MKFSTRSMYGLRALLALARDHGQGSLFLRDIAEREGLPATYLEQLMVPLRKAGLVSAIRGAKGGYTLGRHPRETTVLEVLEALEGPLTLTECPAGSGCCGRPEACALQDLFREGSEALRETFRGVTLAELAERQLVKHQGDMGSWSI